jgi:hypothetical protein
MMGFRHNKFAFYDTARGPEYVAALAKDLCMTPVTEIGTRRICWAKVMSEPFIVETMQRKVKGRPGDYLVLGAPGDIRVVPKDMIETSFEPLGAEI